VEDINITIEPGEKVALVGKMGSGKSTLLKLTLGFHSPTEGALLLSDTDIHQLDPRDIRRNATYVSQDVQILSGTVRDNITLGAPMVSDEQIRHAAGLAGLLEFIQQHPDGFDMQVGEQGNALSGGQRQALCLARAMLKQAPLLLLDEPTSGMDSTAEQHFKDYLQGLNAEVTLVLVTHKSNMLSLVDRLILVNEGKVIADGPRDEVLRSLAGS
jgi:ATP-binding cassette subfamily C protein LapB